MGGFGPVPLPLALMTRYCTRNWDNLLRLSRDYQAQGKHRLGYLPATQFLFPPARALSDAQRPSARSSSRCLSCATSTIWIRVRPSRDNSTRSSWPTAFTRAFAVGNPREFTQAERVKSRRSAEVCNRTHQELHHPLELSLSYARQNRKESAVTPRRRDHLRRTQSATHSPMSWAHINMLGEYDFSDEKLKDSLGILPLKSAA